MTCYPPIVNKLLVWTSYAYAIVLGLFVARDLIVSLAVSGKLLSIITGAF